MKTQQERAAERRRQKLEQVEEQVKSGSLKVRKMTPEERKKYPPVPPKPPRTQR
jgi:hypothetical protein